MSSIASTPPDASFERELAALSTLPVLLVACDYDGTIAPLVDRPEDARPLREAVVALQALAELPATHVAIISGRGLADLAEVSGIGGQVHLVGSHGSEFDPDFADALEPTLRDRRDHLRSMLESLAAGLDGALMEPKPTGAALHVRQVADLDAGDGLLREAEAHVRARLDDADAVQVKHGKRVIEFSVVQASKADAVEHLRARFGASAVVFLGDDVTDEDAFATLRGPDLGVKVGDGDTRARVRVDEPADVARLLARLSEARSDWLLCESVPAIRDHSMLSDHRTIALVDDRASIDWFCAPSMDDAAVFASLLGGATAGRFSITALDDDGAPTQRYRDGSFALESRWSGVELVDFLDCSNARTVQRPGRSDLVRLLRATGDGPARVRIEFAPRIDFGRTATVMEVHDDGIIVDEGQQPMVLRAPGVRWTLRHEGRHETAIAELDLRECGFVDEPLALELRWGTRSLRAFHHAPSSRLADTESFWSGFLATLDVPATLPEPTRALVERSALILQGLFHRPSGAFAAAATTSLPEWIGGVRNWDYRFCWLRDGAMTAASLVRLGSVREAMRFLDWTLGVVQTEGAPDRLRPLYTLAGTHPWPEAEIGELSGYRGSRPVRIGNGAASQVQLDVFGPIAELVAMLAERDAPVTPDHLRLLDHLVAAVSARWQEPDHGIWEIRGPKRHHVHSRTMCWVTVDRAIRVVEADTGRTRPDWVALREAIRDDVLAHGFDAGRDAFTTAYGDPSIDAAVIFIGLSGLIEPDDPRFLGTVAAIERDLLEGPIVYRYRGDDGLPGREGGFLICASWLVEAYRLLGRHDDARALFERICALAGPTGLLAEQHDPAADVALGNVPQAYSHIGVIDNALALFGS